MLKHHAFASRVRTAALLLVLCVLAACGASPQAPESAATVPAPEGAGAPTAYPAPLGGSDAYPSPDASGYPAPQVEATTYPAPLGGGQPTPGVGAVAPTRPPLAITAVPTSGSAVLPSLPPGFEAGEVPATKAAGALADLLQRTGVAAAEVRVVSAESVEWSDGSLGCPRPGIMYPQVITPGYKLVLETGSTQYAYHASENGEFFLCEPTR